MGKDSLRSGGSHRHDYLTDDEKADIGKEFKRLGVFKEDENREQVMFNNKIRRVWENLTNENIDIFLNRNCHEYKLKKTYRF